MQVKEIMTTSPKVISVDATVAEAAKMMSQHDFGCLPIEQNDKLVGMLTDRDITVRVVAANKDPSKTKTKDAMTKNVYYCFENDDVETVLDYFGKQQIHRMPVMNENKRLVGEISLGDIAKAAQNDEDLYELIGETKEQISK